MTTEPRFRAYESADRSACLLLFAENCPEYFAPGERDDYATFLDSNTRSYIVCEQDTRIVGAYGLYPFNSDSAALHWILLSPSAQGMGLGSIIMARVMDELRGSGRAPLHISASHKSAPFFARFGAIETARIADGWGPGMHRVEMELTPAGMRYVDSPAVVSGS